MIRNNLYRAALFSAAGFLALSSFAADRTAQPAPSVLVEKVVLQPEVDGKKFVGRLEAIEEVDLVARVSGYINSINFKEGDIVKKGDLLFELEDTTYRASLQNLLPPSSSHSADHVTAMAAFALGDELVTVHADYPGKVWISPAHSRTLAFSISSRELNETLADFIQQHGAAGDP